MYAILLTLFSILSKHCSMITFMPRHGTCHNSDFNLTSILHRVHKAIALLSRRFHTPVHSNIELNAYKSTDSIGLLAKCSHVLAPATAMAATQPCTHVDRRLSNGRFLHSRTPCSSQRLTLSPYVKTIVPVIAGFDLAELMLGNAERQVGGLLCRMCKMARKLVFW
jgi:hypothetical protein